MREPPSIVNRFVCKGKGRKWQSFRSVLYRSFMFRHYIGLFVSFGWFCWQFRYFFARHYGIKPSKIKHLSGNKTFFPSMVKIGCTIDIYLCSRFLKPKNNGISKRKYKLKRHASACHNIHFLITLLLHKKKMKRLKINSVLSLFVSMLSKLYQESRE